VPGDAPATQRLLRADRRLSAAHDALPTASVDPAISPPRDHILQRGRSRDVARGGWLWKARRPPVSPTVHVQI